MEQWKVIEGFENYMVSNTGKIKNIQEKEVKPADNGRGYKKVRLYKNGKYHKKYIHRLVAIHFIENPHNKPCVNHIDNNPSNNRVENLEWCTHKENMEWMQKQGRAIRTHEQIEKIHEAQRKYYKAVVGTNIVTGEIIKFEYLNLVATSGFQPSCVSNCCKGIRQTHKGYRWQYEKTS